MTQNLTLSQRKVIFGVIFESLSLGPEKSFLSHRKCHFWVRALWSNGGSQPFQRGPTMEITIGDNMITCLAVIPEEIQTGAWPERRQLGLIFQGQFLPIFSENLGLKPSFVSPRLDCPNFREAPVRFGYGLGVERFERFRFSVLAVPLQKSFFFLCFQYSLTGEEGSGSGFGSWKTVPAVPVPLSVSGKTVLTVPVSGSGSVPEPA